MEALQTQRMNFRFSAKAEVRGELFDENTDETSAVPVDGARRNFRFNERRVPQGIGWCSGGLSPGKRPPTPRSPVCPTRLQACATPAPHRGPILELARENPERRGISNFENERTA